MLATRSPLSAKNENVSSKVEGMSLTDKENTVSIKKCTGNRKPYKVTGSRSIVKH